MRAIDICRTAHTDHPLLVEINAYVTVVYTVLGPMVCEICEIPREVIVQAFVYKTKPCASLRGFTTDSGTYGSHSQGHSVGPLVHCHIDSNLHWLWI